MFVSPVIVYLSDYCNLVFDLIQCRLVYSNILYTQIIFHR